MATETVTIVIRPRTGRLRLALWRAEQEARYLRGAEVDPVRHRPMLEVLARHPDVLDAIADLTAEEPTP